MYAPIVERLEAFLLMLHQEPARKAHLKVIRSFLSKKSIIVDGAAKKETHLPVLPQEHARKVLLKDMKYLEIRDAWKNYYPYLFHC